MHLPLYQIRQLDEDIACRKCGYNLRGSNKDGACPECGTAVGRSTHDLLRFSDPTWVCTLASGMNWIVGGVVCGLVAGVATLAAVAAAQGYSLFLRSPWTMWTILTPVFQGVLGGVCRCCGWAPARTT